MSSRNPLRFKRREFLTWLQGASLFKGARQAGYALLDPRRLRYAHQDEKPGRDTIVVSFVDTNDPPPRQSRSRIVLEFARPYTDEIRDLRASILIEEAAFDELPGVALSFSPDSLVRTDSLDAEFAATAPRAAQEREILKRALAQIVAALQSVVIR